MGLGGGGPQWVIFSHGGRLLRMWVASQSTLLSPKEESLMSQDLLLHFRDESNGRGETLHRRNTQSAEILRPVSLPLSLPSLRHRPLHSQLCPSSFPSKVRTSFQYHEAVPKHCFSHGTASLTSSPKRQI